MHNNLIKTTLGYHLPGGGNSTYVHVGEAPGEKTAFAQAVKALKLDMLKQDPEQAEYVLDLKPWAESYERNVEKEQPTLGEAVEIVRWIIRGEEEAGEAANAYLDDKQLAALRELLALAEDVIDNNPEPTMSEQYRTLYPGGNAEHPDA